MTADVQQLESLAQQLAGRVRDDDPEANLRWLRAELGIDPNAPLSDVERLLFVVAAAVPDGQSWRRLIAWTGGSESEIDRNRRRWRESKQRAKARRLEEAAA